MEYIKICGLKDYEDVQICKKYGATAVGFIYNVPSSPRNLKKSELNKLLEKIDNEILTVAVSQPQDISELNTFVKAIQVDYYQIHGNFSEDKLKKIPEDLKSQLILAFKLNSSNISSVIHQINIFKKEFFAFLIDNSEGHGNRLDINLVKELLINTNNKKIIIAGGISIENVEEIIKNVKPFGIDVSSSLESKKGIKDSSKIKNFLKKIEKVNKNIKE
ncbi:MAG: phosphoribosylanthranilate isomerase [Promethearchaeota archaeon]|nr:MAG: phosphoribosylanthranilate isomerase [Candidatus Lokiarchaeota archaeon]